MTCSHVLGLIDAGPFAAFPAAHLDAAWRHASACGTCGPALAASRALSSALAGLAQPAPTPALAAAVLARIARLEERPRAALPSASRAWPAWASTFGALTAAVAIIVTMWRGGPTFVDVMAPGAGALLGGLAPLPGTLAGVVFLAAGLVLYATGLFAALNPRPAENN